MRFRTNSVKEIQRSCQFAIIICLFALSSVVGCKNSGSSSSPAATICNNRGYCKIFVTLINSGGLIDTDSDGNPITEADQRCNSSTSKPDSSTYKAIIVSSGNRVACTSANCATSGTAEHTNWVLYPNQQYRRSDATTIIGTTTANGIFSFNLTNSVDSSLTYYWTGLASNWTLGNNCNNFSTSSAGVSASLGQGNMVDSTSFALADTCNSTVVLACAEQ